MHGSISSISAVLSGCLDEMPALPAASSGNGAPAEPAAQPGVKLAFPLPAVEPTQEGPAGLRFDFNAGGRVELPEAEHPWQVRLSDIATGNILYETVIKAGLVRSSNQYVVPIRIEVRQQNKLILRHDWSPRDREVLIQFPVGTLGDLL